MFAIAVAAAVGVAGADDQGSQGRKTGTDYSNGVFDHRDGTCQHGLIALRIVGSDDCMRC